MRKLSLFVLPAVLLFCGCAKEPIRIGFVGGLTGKMSDLGISGRNGLQIAVDSINKTGGIEGRPLELLVKDDKNERPRAEAAVLELIDSGVEAIVGHMVSSMSLQTASIVTEAETLMISPTTSTPELTGKDDFFIRVMPENTAEVELLVEFAASEGGINSVSAVIDLSNSDFTRPWWDYFAVKFTEAGGTVISEREYNSEEEVDYKQIISDVISGGPEGIVLVTNAFETAMFCQQIAKLPEQPEIIPCGWAMTEDLIRYGGNTVEGLLFVSAVYPESESAEFKKFKFEYMDSFGSEPDFAAINAYNAGMVLKRGFLEKEKQESLKEAIIRIGDFKGLQGEFSIDKFGDAKREYHFLEIRGGGFSPRN